jgi:hypothetical protein
MRELDKDDVPEVSGGVIDGCIPLPIRDLPFPVPGRPFGEPLPGMPRPGPLPYPTINPLQS